MKTRALLFGLFLTLLVALLWLCLPDPEDRVRAGMTVERVKTILGGEPQFVALDEEGLILRWNVRDRTVTVVFDSNKESPLTLGDVSVTGASARRHVLNWIEQASLGWVNFTPDRLPKSKHWAGDPQ